MLTWTTWIPERLSMKMVGETDRDRLSERMRRDMLLSRKVLHTTTVQPAKAARLPGDTR